MRTRPTPCGSSPSARAPPTPHSRSTRRRAGRLRKSVVASTAFRLQSSFAAARVAHLSPAEIAARLHDRFKLLGGGRGRIGRQQTLAATLDWSYNLLSTREQAAIRRLAMCAGGFTVATAEAVVTDADIASCDVLDLLGSLVAKSLVTTGADDVRRDALSIARNRALYAGEKLAAAGEAAEARARYRDAWVAWLEATPLDHLALNIDAIAAVAREIDHLRAAAATACPTTVPTCLRVLRVRWSASA